MGWFDNPAGQLGINVGDAGNIVNSLAGVGLAAGPVGMGLLGAGAGAVGTVGAAAGLGGLTGIKALGGLFGKKEDGYDPNAIGVPDYTSQWNDLAQNLNTKQLGADKDVLQNTSNAAVSNARSNLAMKGGLSAGADERIAKSGMDSFNNAYSNMATKYGLGSADISKQAIEKKQDMDLAIAMGKDRSAAAYAARPKGLIQDTLGSLGL